MNLEDERRLKFDRRLANRRGWVSPEELSAEIASLADASDKIAPATDGEDKKKDREEASQ